MRKYDQSCQYELQIIDGQRPRRQEIEQYIPTRYADAFNLEHYLHQPADVLMTTRCGKPIARHKSRCCRRNLSEAMPSQFD